MYEAVKSTRKNEEEVSSNTVRTSTKKNHVNSEDVITVQNRCMRRSGCTLKLGRSCAYVAKILRTSVAQMLPRVMS
ncbi:hypothetical protein AHAS_Ahas04G0047100 [Arachis hypogaea]